MKIEAMVDVDNDKNTYALSIYLYTTKTNKIKLLTSKSLNYGDYVNFSTYNNSLPLSFDHDTQVEVREENTKPKTYVQRKK